MWKVKNGNKIRVVEDLWSSCGEGFKLINHMIQSLKERDYYKLSSVANPEITTIWSQEWMTARFIGLKGVEADIWEDYIARIMISHVRIKAWEYC